MESRLQGIERIAAAILLQAASDSARKNGSKS